MKKGILALTAVSVSFCYQLAVLKKDAAKLRSVGINCIEEGDLCIYFKGEDKKQSEEIKSYILKKYGIYSFYIGKKVSKNLINVYSYQVATFKTLKKAKKCFEKVKNLQNARIEKIGNYYVVRVGIFNSLKEAKKQKLPYFLIKCNFFPKRVVK